MILLCFAANVGKEFLFGLIDAEDPVSVIINIASSTTGRIYVNASAVGINKHYLINSGALEIALTPKIIQTSNTTVENKAVHIVSDIDISVNVLITSTVTNFYGGFLAFPLHQLLDLSFVVASFPGSGSYAPTEILMVASQDSTKISVGFPNNFTGTFVQNNSMHVTLDMHQTYQLQSGYDLSGTRIKSSAPVSIIAGSLSALIGSKIYPAYIIDQMPPVAFLGTRFIVPSLETRTGYFIKILASENQITVKLQNSTGTYQFMVYNGYVQNILMNSGEPVFISSSRPVMVAQYSLSYATDRKGGGLMMIVPSILNYMDRYDFLISSNQSVFTNFLCVISLTTDVSDISVDSQPLSSSASNTSYIGTEVGNFTISVVKLLPGRYYVASKTRSTTFGAVLYGFYSAAGYGFPLGMRTTSAGNCCTFLA